MFTRRPHQLFAVFGFGDELVSAGSDVVGAFASTLQGLGQQELATTRWETVHYGSRTVRELDRPLACLGCGERASLAVRLDKHDLPYTVCRSCKARMFFRHDASLYALAGWTRWLDRGDGDARWMEALAQGRVVFSRWTRPVLEAGGDAEEGSAAEGAPGVEVNR